MSTEYRYKLNFEDGLAVDTTGEEMAVLIKDISDGYAYIESNGTCMAELSFQDGNVAKFLRGLTKMINETFNGTKTLNDWQGESEQNTHQNLSKFGKSLRAAGLSKGSYFEFNKKDSTTGGVTSVNASNNPGEKPEDDAQKIISEAIEASAKKCVVFTGAPGTGKTYCVEQYVKDKMAGFDRKEYFVQFHSSYDYTDFVEGLRPVEDKNGNMVFRRMDGIFKAFCRKVVERGGEKPFYFVIDEINRADLGRVFGELMYCFEKRGKKHTIATQYKNLDTYKKDEEGNFVCIEEDCFEDGFYIPKNVVIIGTMNDIDRSVETFDFALRRRFDWVEIDANKVMFRSLMSMKEKRFITGEVTEDLVTRITNMNTAIADGPGLSPAFAIGPSYFEGYDGTEKKLQDIWEHNIEPILKEYMRGRQGAVQFIGKCEAALFPTDAQQGAQE